MRRDFKQILTTMKEKLTSFEVGASAMITLLVMVILRIADANFAAALTPFLTAVYFVGGTLAGSWALKDWRINMGLGALGLALICL